MKFFIPFALVFLIGCGGSGGSGATQYVDKEVIVYVDRNITEYVDKEVIVYVDRNITEYIEPLSCSSEVYDSKFSGRIIYEDKSPYKRGAIKAQGSGWVSYALTDDNGSFSFGVRGDSRFIFSAYSPYGDYIFYSFDGQLIVPRYSEDGAYECEYNEEILECYEKEEIK